MNISTVLYNEKKKNCNEINRGCKDPENQFSSISLQKTQKTSSAPFLYIRISNGDFYGIQAPEYLTVPLPIFRCFLLTVETWSWRRNHLTGAPDPKLPEVDRTVSRGAGGRVAEPCCPAWIYGEASNCDGLAKHSKVRLRVRWDSKENLGNGKFMQVLWAEPLENESADV